MLMSLLTHRPTWMSVTTTMERSGSKVQAVEVKHDTHHVQVTQPKVWNFIKRVEEVNPFTDEARIVQD